MNRRFVGCAKRKYEKNIEEKIESNRICEMFEKQEGAGWHHFYLM